jgi:GH24 family phage-related lysozyme (muramidase)
MQQTSQGGNMNGGYKISPQGLSWIEQCEGGFKRNPYDNDGNGTHNCTVGYGHLLHPDRCRGDEKSVSEPEAATMLRGDVRPAETWLTRNAGAPLAQNQVDALGSMIQNMGVKHFDKYSIGQDTQDGKLEDVSNEIEHYEKGGGGLIPRRIGEKSIYDYGIYPVGPKACSK